MSLEDKPEYPPLFPPGLHPMRLAKVRSRCVDDFPGSQSRPEIMDGIEALVAKLTEACVIGELLVNGSFLTECPESNDADTILRVNYELEESGTDDQVDAIWPL